MLVYDGDGDIVAEMGAGCDRRDALADMVSMLNPGVVIEMLDAMYRTETLLGKTK